MVPSSAVTARHSRAGWKERVRMFRCVLARLARPVGLTAALCLFSFVSWFGLPSPFAAALLLAFGTKPPAACLAGLGAGMGLRLLWGVNADVWQYAGCAAMWLLLQKCRARAGIETAALGGLCMMPRVFAAMAAHQPLDILLSCAAVPLCMLFSACMRCGLDAAQTGALHRSWERLCLLLIGLVAVSGLGFFRIGPVELGPMSAVFAAMIFAWANGAALGVAGGVLCGLALAMGGYDSRIVLVLSLCGFSGGLPMVCRRRWLAPAAAALCNVLAWFVTPLSHPPIAWLTLLAGSLAYALISGSALDALKPYLHGLERGDRSMENAFISQRIAHMRQAIHNLAQALPEWPEETISTGEELGALLCAQCPNRELCWGRSRIRTEQMLSAMMERSARGETLEEEEILSLSDFGCVRSASMPQQARSALMLRQKRSASASKARYEREVTLTHLAALSGTLADLGQMAAGESFNDLRAAHVIRLAMEELGIPARLRYARRVDGHLQAALEAEGVLPMQKPLEQLLHRLAAEEDMPLSIARMEKGQIELEEIPLYSASVGMASACAGGQENVCGDACCAKRCEGGRLWMMLCDGMGHGERALQQSEKTLELLLLLLEAGYTRRQAITAVNGIMLGSQNEERFSTVDLADVDLWTGEVFGDKLGACASWVVRGSHMKKMEGSSLPLGIVQEATPTAVQFRLHSGDILILMSDGVADVFPTDAQIKKALELSLHMHPQRMADEILKNALVASGGISRDDMTVIVLLLMNRSNAA